MGSLKTKVTLSKILMSRALRVKDWQKKTRREPVRADYRYDAD